MTFCPNCGSKVSENSLYCPVCGHQISHIVSDNETKDENNMDDFLTTNGHTKKDKINQPEIDDSISSNNIDPFQNINSNPNIPSNFEYPFHIDTRTARYSSSKNIWLIILLFLSIILIALMIFFYLLPSDKKIVNNNDISETTIINETQTTQIEETEIIHEEIAQQFHNFTIQPILNNYLAANGEYSAFFLPIKNAENQPINVKPEIINDQPIRAASMIKLYILITFFTQVDEGKISLQDTYILRDSDKVGGTGNIQNAPAGTRYTYYALVSEMMTNSDNTAANIMTDLVGGIDTINQNIQRLGYQKTKMHRKMMDTSALAQGIDNYVTASELGDTLEKLYNKQLISPELDQKILDLISLRPDLSKLGKELPPDITIYGKTGQFQEYGIVNDAQIIENYHGSYILVILSQDGNYQTKINAFNNIGREVFNQFNIE